MFSLKDKIAVVTGGASGIGLGVVKVLHEAGATVHVIDLNTSNADSAKAEDLVLHACDVSDQQKVRDVFNSIGKVDILVNAAGIAHVGNVETTKEDDLDRLYSVNIKGIYNCIHCAVPPMKMGGGVILNVSSIAAHIGLTDRFAYSMTKGAVHAMTLSVAKDYLPYKIRCNSISPARVHTPFVDGFISKNYPGRESEMFDKLSASQPIGRMGKVEEIAALVLYLASDEAAFITGSDFPIDGGYITLNG